MQDPGGGSTDIHIHHVHIDNGDDSVAVKPGESGKCTRNVRQPGPFPPPPTPQPARHPVCCGLRRWLMAAVFLLADQLWRDALLCRSWWKTACSCTATAVPSDPSAKAAWRTCVTDPFFDCLLRSRLEYSRDRFRSTEDVCGLQVLYRNISMTAQECGNRVKTYSSTEGGGHVR
eukprot:COSAG04_NODE_8791_length_931_cov_2.721359_1_plen_174_part_00